MSDLKTKPTGDSVDAFVASIDDAARRRDCEQLAAMMRDATGDAGEMWGPSIAGFGRYVYRYASGREGEWFLVGFAPRKRNLTLYIMSGFDDYDALLERLGKHTTGKSCLYVSGLDDVDREALRQLVEASVAHMREAHPSS